MAIGTNSFLLEYIPFQKGFIVQESNLEVKIIISLDRNQASVSTL